MARQPRSKFSLLLLDDGEFLLAEYAALVLTCCSPAPAAAAGEAETFAVEGKARGRLRLCTRGLYFESDDARAPVIKWAFRQMPGKPTLLPAWPFAHSAPGVSRAVATESLQTRDAVVVQVSAQTEMKASGIVGPYKCRAFGDEPLPAAAAGKAAAATGATGQHAAGRQTYVLVLLHLSAATVLPLLQQVWNLQQKCLSAPSGFEGAAVEQQLLLPRREGPFNLSLLADYREKPLLPAAPAAIAVERIFPLVSSFGRVMLTERALYIQPVPINNVAGSEAVTTVLLRDIKRVLRRRRLQRETAIEVLLHEGAASCASSATDALAAGMTRPAVSSSTGGGIMGGGGPALFLAFQSPGDRDRVYLELLNALRERSRHHKRLAGAADAPGRAAEAAPSEFFDDELGDPTPAFVLHMLRSWQLRRVSNYDYLSFLNTLAGRTHSDLTQFPIFPWVIADYASPALDLAADATYRDLSKPVGALNAARLEALKARYREMPTGPGCDPPFLYGTHYSTPGYCLFYLVRAMPEHMLHLQSGRFDAPDRLFCDVAATWASVTGTSMDVKELIPAFYDGDGSFLLAPEGLDLGTRQSGRRVGDVGLPPWAFDAADFVARNREALESPHVSERLAGWIDLVFGCRQRGAAAIAADNIFHHMTYEGAVDIEAIADANLRAAAQAQVAEYGQTPRQLFRSAHPARNGPPLQLPLPVAGGEAADAPSLLLNLLASGAAASSTAATAAAVAAAAPAARRAEQRRRSSASGSGRPSQDHLGRSFLEPEYAPGPGDRGESSGAAAVAAAEVWSEVCWSPVHLFSASEPSEDVSNAPVLGDLVSAIALSPPAEEAAGGEGLHLLAASRDGSLSLRRLLLTESVAAVGDVLAYDGSVAAAAAVQPSRMPLANAPASTTVLSSFLLMFQALNGNEAPLPVSCVDLAAAGRVAFAGCWDGSIYILDVRRFGQGGGGRPPACLCVLKSHSAAVSCIRVVPLPARVGGAAAGGTGSGRKWAVVVAAGSWDQTVSVQSVVITEGETAANGDDDTLPPLTVAAQSEPDLRVTEHASQVTALDVWTSANNLPGADGGGADSALSAVAAAAPTTSRSRWCAHFASGDAAGRVLWFAAFASKARGCGSGGGGPAAADSGGIVLDCDILGASDELSADALQARGDVTVGGVSGITCVAWVPPIPVPGRTAAELDSAAGVASRQGREGAVCFACTVDGRVAAFQARGSLGPRGGATSSLALAGVLATGEVLRCVATSPDGECVATGGNAGVVRLWSTAALLEGRLPAADAAAHAQVRRQHPADTEAARPPPSPPFKAKSASSGTEFVLTTTADCLLTAIAVAAEGDGAHAEAAVVGIVYAAAAAKFLSARAKLSTAGNLKDAAAPLDAVGSCDGSGGRSRSASREAEAAAAANGDEAPEQQAASGRPRGSQRLPQNTGAALNASPAPVLAPGKTSAIAGGTGSSAGRATLATASVAPESWVTALAFDRVASSMVASAAGGAADDTRGQYLLAAGTKAGRVLLWAGKRLDPTSELAHANASLTSF